MELETQRLKIRPITLDDKNIIFEYRCDIETNKYQSWIPKNINEVETFISRTAKQINEPETWFQLVIIDKATDTVIGDVGIHFIDSYQCEIGCTLRKNYHGKGFATETLKAVIDYLFKILDKHRIIVSIDLENTESIKLIERLGFRKEAHFQKSLFIKGNWVDDIIYAILKTEWN